ncbi:hypothetical protein [Streptobacillus moniliformis]|uniref:hypothetical protein n=2 Tax=Streptobacillus moniliformis TaxID=34105 RepID=UPI0007E311B9|nr:hypothetical protein [Streptobacillus moniliformis]
MDSNRVLTLEINNNRVIGYINGDYTNQGIFKESYLVNEEDVDLSKLAYYVLVEGKLMLEIDKYTNDCRNELIVAYFEELDRLKLKTIENGIEWKEGLIQRGRETDKVNLTSSIQSFETARKLKIPLKTIKWKFITKEGNYVVKEVTETDLQTLFIKGSQLLSKAIVSENVLRDKIEKMSLEELESLDLEKEYQKIMLGSGN